MQFIQSSGFCVLMPFTLRVENNQEKDRAYETHLSAELVFLETGYYTIELGNVRV